MSIIYEALKKIETQKPLSSDKLRQQEQIMLSAGPDVHNASTLTRVVSAKHRPNKLFLNIAIALGVFLSVMGIFLVLRLNTKTKSTMAKHTSVKSTAIVAITYPAASVPFLVKPQELVLEGIIYDEKAPLAIINGKVFRHYECLGNYMVIDITDKEVTLRDLSNDSLLHLALPF